MDKFTAVEKLDRRRKYFMVLDCETATLPYAQGLPENIKKDIAIAKPLIYDIGWQIVDKKGRVYSRQNFLITEIFSVPEIFNTAYYASKRPIYLEKLKNGEIGLTTWQEAMEVFEKELSLVEGVGAYNSMFDFKKAIPFTELYINHLYSPTFHKWLDFQNHCCDEIVNHRTYKPKKEFEPDVFRFRGNSYPLFDIWGLACNYILNDDKYKETCIKEGWQTASGKYFKTSAETAFRFVTGEMDFDEAHTAIDDATIESEILAIVVKRAKNQVEMGIEYFPFRILGTVGKFIFLHPELEEYL